MFTTSKAALVLIDVYNEFLHPSGKINPLVKDSMATNSTLTHLHDVVAAARTAHLPIYYALHQTYREENYQGWLHMNATTTGISNSHAIEEGSWGAEIYEGLEPDVKHGDVVVSRHWNSR
jgi:nicotinamidase-related amidase